MLGCLRKIIVTCPINSMNEFIICIFVTVNLQDNKIINLKKKKYAY